MFTMCGLPTSRGDECSRVCTFDKKNDDIVFFQKSQIEMFPVQIQWEFASAVPFSSAAGGVSAVDGIAPRELGMSAE